MKVRVLRVIYISEKELKMHQELITSVSAEAHTIKKIHDNTAESWVVAVSEVKFQILAITPW